MEKMLYGNSVIITVGLPASGKTTWAKDLVESNPGVYKRVNKDDLRALLDFSHYTKENEEFLLSIRDKIITDALDAGWNVIVDDTNINPKHIARIRELVKGKAAVLVKGFLNVSASECIKRDALRTGSAHVGKDAILRMLKEYKSFNKDFIPELHAYELNFPEWVKGRDKLIICDIDGTLNLITNRSPYDVANSGKDMLNKHTADILETYYEKGDVQIYLVTGRKEEFRAITMVWLDQHKVKYDHLIMRKNDDHRPDDVVKKEIYEAMFKDKFNILFVLEDRDRVVAMYRKELNLPVHQVKYGDY